MRTPVLLIPLAFILSGCFVEERQLCSNLEKVIDTYQPLHLTAPSGLNQTAFEFALRETASASGVEASFKSTARPVEQCVRTLAAISKKHPEVSLPNLAGEVLHHYIQQLDPHSWVINQFDLFERGARYDFGFSIERSRSDGLIRVTDVVVNGPAHAARIQKGTIVVAVNGIGASSADPAELAKLVRATKDNLVLEVQDPFDIRREITLHRFRYEVPAFEAHMEPGDIGYIRVRHLSEGRTAFTSAISSILMARALILDLRDVQGGKLDLAGEVADCLVSDGEVFAGLLGRDQKSGRIGLQSEIPLSLGSLWDGPIVVLVNSETKSAAEALAGALQDYGVVVVGSQTFGKGTTQITKDLREFRIPAFLELTNGFIVRPSGSLIQLDGVTPDIRLPTGKVERREQMNQGYLDPPETQQPLSLYDPSTLPFQSRLFRSNLKQMEQDFAVMIAKNKLGHTTSDQHLTAAAHVAKLLIEHQDSVITQLQLPLPPANEPGLQN